MATDQVMTRWRRAGYAALSGLAGWLAAQIVCLPVNLITAVRDSEGEARLFVQTLSYGLFVWAGWSFVLSLLAWTAVVLPLVLTIRPCLVVRARYLILVAAPALALGVAGVRPAMFVDSAAESFLHRFAEFIPYAGFGFTFAVVTAWTYIVLSRRRLDRAAVTAPAAVQQTVDSFPA